jgi:hypothetical protein
MRNFNSAVPEQKKPLSVKLLISCFMAGWLLATLVFALFRPQIHHLIDHIL